MRPGAAEFVGWVVARRVAREPMSAVVSAVWCDRMTAMTQDLAMTLTRALRIRRHGDRTVTAW
ncbi:MAG: hypothetical protein BGO26_18840 [Actinobacteria bacterium 69-20]|nr:MAG: hypothetical protein BGO26_18840 [Actinobacteria bacterium 69-20]